VDIRAAPNAKCNLDTTSHSSPEPQQHQKAKSNEGPQNDPIPPLLRANPPYQTIHPWHLTRGTDNPPLNTCQTLPLDSEIIIHGISLAQHTIRDIMRVVDTRPLVEHVLRFGGGWVCGAVGIDVRTHIREEVGAIASFSEGRL